MGSPCEFRVYAETERHAHMAIQQAYTEVIRLERKYTRYREDSITTLINNRAHQEDICVDHETAMLLNYADTAYVQSEGLFDITSGVLRKAWNFKKQIIPTQKNLDLILQRVGWDKVEWNGSCIHFQLAGMEIDFGGYVKEYAVDAAVKVLLNTGIIHGLVDLGGDIKIAGPHPDGQAWRIGIRNPAQPEQALALIHLSHGGLASSGDYERCIWVDGKRYSHILNPKTGWPVNGLSAVSVHADECLIAGSCTTFSMLKPQSAALQWLDETGLAYVAVDQELNIYKAGSQEAEWSRKDSRALIQSPVNARPWRPDTHDLRSGKYSH